jgi:hypothetical protein
MLLFDGRARQSARQLAGLDNQGRRFAAQLGEIAAQVAMRAALIVGFASSEHVHGLD